LLGFFNRESDGALLVVGGLVGAAAMVRVQK